MWRCSSGLSRRRNHCPEKRQPNKVERCPDSDGVQTMLTGQGCLDIILSQPSEWVSHYSFSGLDRIMLVGWPFNAIHVCQHSSGIHILMTWKS